MRCIYLEGVDGRLADTTGHGAGAKSLVKSELAHLVVRLDGPLHLLVRHKLERRLRANLEHVNPIAAPQAANATLAQHVPEATHDIAVSCAVDLQGRSDESLVVLKQTRQIYSLARSTCCRKRVFFE